MAGAPAPADGNPACRADEVGFRLSDEGIWVPLIPLEHRADDYDESAFAVLADMQVRHFWYRGRHRYVHHALRTFIDAGRPLDAIDLGGGCGGWVRFLGLRGTPAFRTLALSDSSVEALRIARDVVPPGAPLYQTDLLDLPWDQRWDVIFLLDVIEHVNDDHRVMREVRRSLRPGGVAVVTVPALRTFWSYNDDLAGHKRRYAKADFETLATAVGVELVHRSYFMFFLSPLLLASRLVPPKRGMSHEETRALLRRAHRVPAAPVNALLASVFAAESPVGLHVPFPWGTSLLGVFRRPA